MVEIYSKIRLLSQKIIYKNKLGYFIYKNGKHFLEYLTVYYYRYALRLFIFFFVIPS